MKVRPAALAALLVAAPAAAAAPPAAAPPAAEPSPEAAAKALTVLARTKTVTGTYALYMWNRLTPPEGPAYEEWSAEFNAGDLHRVETPHDRLVANCRTGEGYAYSVETGRSSDGAAIARTACGIDTNAPFLSAVSQGEVATPFGRADRVQVTTAQLVRRYDVSRDGILLATVYEENTPEHPVRLANWAVGLERALPEPGMFDRASLARSYVPAHYKRSPPAK
jgi:hypothetical protein